MIGTSLVLAVLFISANWDLRNATFTVILATIAYNYFRLSSLFTVADPQNQIALFTFSRDGASQLPNARAVMPRRAPTKKSGHTSIAFELAQK